MRMNQRSRRPETEAGPVSTIEGFSHQFQIEIIRRMSQDTTQD